MKILVVAAHPDDEVLGCGGTIARLTRGGHEVCVTILGEGISARYPNRQEADRESIENLRIQARQVAESLGVQESVFYDLPDNRFDTIPLLDIVKTIEEVVSRVGPQTVYTHHGGDLNIDHAIVHRAVLTATRPLPGCPVKEVYSFVVPSSTEWAFGQLEPHFRPNFFVDIVATLEAKVQAMLLYESELREFPHPRSPEALRATARRWGSAVGVEAAEAFELVRRVW